MGRELQSHLADGRVLDQIPLRSDFSTNVSVKLASRIADETEVRKKKGDHSLYFLGRYGRGENLLKKSSYLIKG
jgi:hypothetical protein